MGLPGIEVEAAKPFKVWPQNRQSFEVFLAMADQWRIVAGMGGAFCQGLDLSALAKVMKWLGVKKKRRSQVFNDLRAMSAAAREILNRRA